MRFNDVVTVPGKVFGPGTVNCDGNMAPGTNPALVAFDGDVVFGTNSTLFIELAGNGGAAGTDFDQLLVSSTTTLGGDLEIDFLGDFMPDPLDSFIILSAATLTGAFDNVVDGGRLDALGGGTFLVNYDGITSAVVLSDFMAGFAGDFEPDGDVDGFGFLKWQRGELTDPLSQSNLAD